jgi:hypothetical protein
MTQKYIITLHLTPADVLIIEANIAASKLNSDPLNIVMTAAQTKALVKIGPQRIAENEAIHTKLLKPFPSTIPATYTLAQFEALQQERIDSYIMAGLYKAEADKYTAHGDIVGNNLYLMGKEGLDNARFQMNTSTGIKTGVEEITTEFFTHTAANGATVYSIAPSMSLVINNLVTGKRIINDGITILTMLVDGGNGANKITIYPGDSAEVPKTWTNVTITNISATSSGSFQVFVK